MIRILPLAALLLAAPACAQRRDVHVERHENQTHLVHTDHDRRLEIIMRGDVEMNDAGDWVERMGPDGSVLVDERSRGTTRRLEFTPGGGGAARVRYRVNGRDREMDAAAREWARGAIFQVMQSSPSVARQRVARIRQRGGVPAVLNEVGRLRGDAARRAWYVALLEGAPLSDGEMQRVMADVDRRMESDTERRLVLVSALDHARGDAAAGAVLGAAAGMDSDLEKRLVLQRALERGRVSGAAEQGFFRTVDGIGSDLERRIILTRWLERGGDADAAFFRAVGEFDSDLERRIVLTQLLRESPSESATVAALQSAGRMGSDLEKRIVLMEVPRSQLRSTRVTTAYRAVVNGMRSDHERSISLQRLARGS